VLIVQGKKPLGPARLLNMALVLGLALAGWPWLIGFLGCQAARPVTALTQSVPADRPAAMAAQRDADIAAVDPGGWVYTDVAYRGETHQVNVYLPASYPGAAPFPVVYMLHGWGMHPEMWQRSDVEGQAELYDLVLVAVEGDADAIAPSWYSRQTNLPYPAGGDWTISFYEWFFDGVLPWVETNYLVRTDPGGRGLMGFSMGGKGALSLAGHRPDLFAATVDIAGVTDLRDYSTEYEIPETYGPLGWNEMVYAADSPIDLAPNLKGLSITMLHGDADTWVDNDQSRRMSQALDELGYPHLWEELPGQDHEPVTTYEITRSFERLAAAFDASYHPPTAWRYRFADDLAREVYGTVLTKTNPLTWTEVLSVTDRGFEMMSGDAISVTTAGVYTPQASYVVTVTNLTQGGSAVRQTTADGGGRLTLAFPAGRYRATIGQGGTTIPEPLLPLTVTLGGSGSGTVTSSPAGIDCGPSCSAAYPNGTVVTLTATPALTSTFAGWDGACSGAGICVLTMTEAKNVTATWICQRIYLPLVLRNFF
jgi:S-formylglutathione hydrolase FrmB